MRGRLILSGGGSGEDERLLLESLVSTIGTDARLLYWPMAMPPERHAQCLTWIQDTFRNFGFDGITMWTDFNGRSPGDLSKFDAIFIGGGCTYLLSRMLKESGFDQCLVDYHRSGGTIYGGSAGAIIFGVNIETCAHIDRNTCGLLDMSGLNLVKGMGVACHYRPAHRKILEACVDKFGAPVIALNERNGIILDATGIRVAGHEPAQLIGKTGIQLVASGDKLVAEVTSGTA